MKQADIETGGEYAWGSYNGLSRVRVTAKGKHTKSYSRVANGVEVEHVGGWPFEGRKVVASRDIAPWDERHDERLRREADNRLREERVQRVAKRLEITVLSSGSFSHAWVRMPEDDLFALAERLGVETD